ncbi:MAG: hypothetical protein NTW30_06060 [Candidatus Aenigmarchaeota archaeon]|nr:hypothetical protein [Candidatus Aenigmarchaeota archaeon]
MELIPIWFYAITSIIYSAFVVTDFIICYLGYKSYRVTSKKSFLLLSVSFLIFGLGFLALAFTDIYIYTTLELYGSSTISLNLLNYQGFSMYYALSLISYVLLVLMYLPEKIKKLFVIYVPIWYASSVNFHIISIILILYVVFQCILNSIKKRSLNSYLVTFAFIALAVFHLLLIFTPFSQSMYIFANLFLLVGFLSLLYMLVRVNSSE